MDWRFSSGPAVVGEDLHLERHRAGEPLGLRAVEVGLDLVGARHGLADQVLLRAVALGEVARDQPRRWSCGCGRRRPSRRRARSRAGRCRSGPRPSRPFFFFVHLLVTVGLASSRDCTPFRGSIPRVRKQPPPGRPRVRKNDDRAAIIAEKDPVSLINFASTPGMGRQRLEAAVRALRRRRLDWHRVLSVETHDGGSDSYPLDLLTFSCIMRAASGYLPDGFYGHDVRRIMKLLGCSPSVAALAIKNTIDVMVRGRMHTVTLEEGGVIVVSGTEA